MRKICLAVLIVISFLPKAKGQTSIKVVEDYHKDKIAFFEDWWQNPAMRFAFPIQQFTDVSLNYRQENNEAFATQKGADLNVFTFRANSFFRDTTQLYYGKAMYSKWNVEGYNWNTIADVDLLQPYIVADTIGGKMYNEKYIFAGGYARRFSKFSLGALASFRAMTSYKKKDPRPENTVSDLHLNLGAAWEMSNTYSLGVTFLFKKYTQDNKISIFKDGSGTMLYYLRGLGIADEHFSTVITYNSSPSNKYKLNDYGILLSLFPTEESACLAMLSYEKKDLGFLYQKGTIWQDISDLQTNLAKGSFGYRFQVNDVGFLTKIYGQYGNQIGTEYIYKMNGLLLSTAEKYKNTNYLGGFEVLGTYAWKNVNSLTKLNVAYSSQEERYGNAKKITSSAKDVGNITLNLQENLLWNFEKSAFLAKVALGYRHNLNKDLRAGTLTADGARANLIQPNYLFEISDYFAGQLTLRYDYQLNEKFRIYGKGMCYYANYDDLGNRQYFQIAIGVSF